mmetsp:Transcript_1654/g.5252  ORF Transcript_1654/g.5252 Transcript_1654/m.5252 type:complete len:238 (-) Transcript_1654:20-733(-)
MRAGCRRLYEAARAPRRRSPPRHRCHRTPPPPRCCRALASPRAALHPQAAPSSRRGCRRCLSRASAARPHSAPLAPAAPPLRRSGGREPRRCRSARWRAPSPRPRPAGRALPPRWRPAACRIASTARRTPRRRSRALSGPRRRHAPSASLRCSRCRRARPPSCETTCPSRSGSLTPGGAPLGPSETAHERRRDPRRHRRPRPSARARAYMRTAGRARDAGNAAVRQVRGGSGERLER